MYTDRDTSHFRRFAFVEIAEKSVSIKTISGLNGISIDNRTVVVNEARLHNDTGRSDRYDGFSGGRQRDTKAFRYTQENQ